MKGRKYGVNDPDGITRTENYLGRFRRDGRLTRMHKMRDLDSVAEATVEGCGI